MLKIFALIGERGDVASERQKLTQAGFPITSIHVIQPETTTEELLKKVLKHRINNVVCIKTKNGQTSFWASELDKMKKSKDPHSVNVFGIDIPPHPQGVTAKSMTLVKMITCVKQVFAKTG